MKNVVIFSCSVLLAFLACRQRDESRGEWSGLTAADGHVPSTAGLAVRPGYIDFIAPNVLRPFKEALPSTEDPEIDALLRSPDTMWYDDDSMVFAYQDSQETVVGIRANPVGYKVGMRNRSNPGIHRLVHYFQPKGFKFPFATTAGTDDSPNVKVYTIWKPFKASDGRVMPVVWWRAGGSRDRWRWVFPNGTVFGEILYIKNPQGKWICFEIRIRKRYADGWEVDLFRPFTQATDLAQAIKQKRSNWQEAPDLRQLVTHLESTDTLTPKTIHSEPYRAIFEGLKGGMDVLPPVSDASLVTELLTTTTFKSQLGVAWKSHGNLEAYAPSTDALYHVVPKNYTAGLIAVNEVSCNRCHEDTGRRVGELEVDVSLYGEIWGEDRIFSWHLFKPKTQMYNTFDMSWELNPRLVQAGLVQKARPQADGSNPTYKTLPLRFRELDF